MQQTATVATEYCWPLTGHLRWPKNPSKVGKYYGEKVTNQPRTETILHIVLKFQFNHLCFQGGEASWNFARKVESEEAKKKKKRSIFRYNNSNV